MSQQTRLQRIILDLEDLKDEVSRIDYMEDLDKAIDILKGIRIYEKI